MAEPRRRQRGERRRGSWTRRVPVAALAVLLVAVPVVWAVASIAAANAERVSLARFEQNANQAAVRSQSVLESYFDKLRGEGAFLSANPLTTREQFAEFVRQSQVLDDLPSINGILYVEKVAPDGLDAFVAERRRVDPSFTVIELYPPAPGAAHWITTQYLPGTTDLKLPIGFDVGFLPVVKDLAAVGERTGHGMAASIQEDPSVQGATMQLQQVPKVLDVDFYIGTPVFRSTPDGNPQGDFRGVVVAPINRFDEVFRAAGAGTPDDLGLRLRIDLSSSGIGNRSDLERVTGIESAAGPQESATFRQDRTFSADGVEFQLSVWSPPSSNNGPLTFLIIVVAGLIVALAVAVLVELRVRALRELADRAQLQHDIIDSATDAMVVIDGAGRVVSANAAWVRLRGMLPDDGDPVADAEGVGEHYLDLIGRVLDDGDDHRSDAEVQSVTEALRAAIEGSADQASVTNLDVRLRARPPVDARWYTIRATPLRDNRGAVVVHTDITDRKHTQDEFEYRATHDELTGLANRPAMEAAVERALAAAPALETDVALLFIDLDGFKAINDRFGHPVGDEALRLVAKRLTGAVRSSDRLGRLGGDEFVVLLPSVADPRIAQRAAERVLAALEDDLVLSTGAVPLGASVGVAIASPDDDWSQLLRRADGAMYAAKQRGGHRFLVDADHLG